LLCVVTRDKERESERDREAETERKTQRENRCARVPLVSRVVTRER